MRRPEEVVVLQRLFRIRRLVAARDTERVVELEAAFAAALQIDAEIFPRRRKVVAFLGTGSGRRIDGFTKTFLGLAAGDDDLPGLAVAPGRRALRDAEEMFNRCSRHGLRQKGAHRIALVQE